MEMKLVKRVNPFSGGGWRGPGADQRFIFDVHINGKYSNSYYAQIDGMTARRLIEANGASWDDFKDFHRAYHGSPKRFCDSGKWRYSYVTDCLWDFCFQRGFGEYPAPRLNSNNQLVDENGNPWRQP